MLYDYDGTVTTHNYVLDGTNIIKETITSGSNTDILEYYYDEAGIAGFVYNGTKYYYVKNIQGDVIEICNTSGISVVSYTYDAWGNILSITGSLASTVGQINPFRYRGYYYDSETDFYYLNSRYYDAEVGRFINADGIIGANGGIVGFNMFAYCNNNPIMFADPSGMCVHNDMYHCEDCQRLMLAGKYNEFVAEYNASLVPKDNNTYFNDDLLEYGLTQGATASTDLISLFFAYLCNGDADMIGSGSAISLGMEIAFVSLEVAVGIAENVEEGESWDKITYDALIDVTVSGGSLALQMFVCAKVGALVVGSLGTAVSPGVGSVAGGLVGGLAGASVGTFCWVIFDVFGLRDALKDLYQ